ncbi:MAG: hypothetical protein KZQ70_10125 [gamma proteobacterium symbiont of Lucinoma myriamae]|nr:hypothetical protein [gamma proteobacterium symbiont of Lucinoma myriamae]MCU7818428.1 hypothetical protein [gamma proteobacterium symbiont of Lucinoma myriamae]
MFKIIPIMILIFILPACTTVSNNQYGNYIDNEHTTYDEQIANDVIQKIQKSFSPANTRFNLKQESDDAFGQLLVSTLRSNGYALSELGDLNSGEDINNVKVEKNNPYAKKPIGYDLNYIVDQPMQGFYRVTLLIGKESLSRAYLIQDSLIQPASAWIHKE